MPANRLAALRSERQLLLEVCASLSMEQWRTPSRATGWTVHDVVAHIGSGCHAMFSSAAATMLFSSDIERTNEDFVYARRSWSPRAVLDEYRLWSGRVITLAGVVSRTPLARIPLPLAELGKFHAALLLAGALVFDHHTHLRHDVLPALGLPDPGIDMNCAAVVTEWMIAVLRNQLKRDAPVWLDRPISLSLSGNGGGTWMVQPGGRLVASSEGARTCVQGKAAEFPEWGTKRCDWRNRSVSITGDHDYGGQLLDYVNVV